MSLATRGRACPQNLDPPGELKLPIFGNPDIDNPAEWMKGTWEETRRLDAEHLLVAIVDTPPERLQEIPGIGPKMSEKIHNGLVGKIPLIEDLLEVGVAVFVDVTCTVGALFTVDDEEGDTIYVLLVSPQRPDFPPFVELRSSDGYRLMGPWLRLLG